MIYRLRTVTLAILLGATSAASFASGAHTGDHEGSATGKPGKAANVTRTISVDMTDNMRFSSADIAVKQGETIRFVVQNSGKIKHEMVLGTARELKEHSEVMKKNPEMEHAEENMISVAPGKTGEIIWQFTKSGKVDFACLQPGHYDAGMKGAVNVAADRTFTQKTLAGTAQAAFSTTIPTGAESAKTTAAPASSPDMADGEIRKVDLLNSKVTIKHGVIKNLDMPGMTMVFQVKDAALLDKVKAGDKVSFSAEKAGSAIVVTDIQMAK